MKPTKREIQKIVKERFDGVLKGFISFLDFESEKHRFVCRTYAYRLDRKKKKYDICLALKQVEGKSMISISQRLYYTRLGGYQFYMNHKQRISYYINLAMEEFDDNKPHMRAETRKSIVSDVPSILINPEEILKDEAFKYFPEDKFYDLFSIYKNKIKTIERIRIDPYRAEMILKNGNAKMLRDKRFFRLNKRKLIEMINYYTEAVNHARYLDEYWKFCSTFYSFNCLEWNIKNRINPDGAFSLSQIKEMGRYSNLGFDTLKEKAKLNEYLKKQRCDLNIYGDFIRLRKDLGLNIKSDSARFPKDLMRAHDNLVKRSKAVKDAKVDKELTLRAKELQSIISKSQLKDYEIFIPKKSNDFKLIGERMSNCVGAMDYNQRVADREDIILALKQGQKFYCCIEIAPNDYYKPKLKQCYLSHNREPESAILNLVKRKIVPKFKNYFVESEKSA